MRRFMMGLALLGATTFGCGHAVIPPPVHSEAALGRVVVYRNGVAYFERRAQLRGRELSLTVPRERLDDFLKSLTVLDAKTGRPLPVSFPTVHESGDEAELVILLPDSGPHDLRVSYVTESPAWKPTYRVVLGRSGKARLEAWAVVDNVSGEDWEKVAIGVGSTSALSFKYDLQNVRLVQRETLSDERALAHAPPSGGSPYTVASSEVRMVAALDLDDLDTPNSGAASQPVEYEASASEAAEDRAKAAPSAPAPVAGRPARKSRASAGPDTFAELAQRLKKDSAEKLRIEGFARESDQDGTQASQDRANAVRERLIAAGAPPAQVEAVGTGQLSAGQAARVVVANSDAAPTQAAPPDAATGDEPVGDAYFLAKAPMTIKKNHSAMVNMLSSETNAHTVYYYDPISSRGSQRFAFKAVLLDNPSDYTLDRGPFTVYAGDQFLGEGLSEPIPPKSRAFIPYALDRQVIVEPKLEHREEIDRLVTIERGIVRAEIRMIQRTVFDVHNRGTSEALVFIRHQVAPGYELDEAHQEVQRLGATHLFPITVKPGRSFKLEIEEHAPGERRYDVSTRGGVESVGLYLKQATKLPKALHDGLQEVLVLHRELADTEQRILALAQQIQTYRARVDEINVQLVTLRKVEQASRLSRHLATKMSELTDRLQTATIEKADLEGMVLVRRIALQDKLAELTLADDEPEKSAAAAR